jgi:hypothetical protein
VRFRHKLSIVLVGLAVAPLVGAGLIVQALLAGDEVRSVDSKLSAGAAGAAAVRLYGTRRGRRARSEAAR